MVGYSNPLPDKEYEEFALKYQNSEAVRNVNQQYSQGGYLLDANSTRELNVSTGAYTPVKGIYSLGWDEWKNYPAADFVKELQQWHYDFLRDRRDEPYHPFFAPAIKNGELTLDQLKFVWRDFYYRADSIVENYAYQIARAKPYRVVRDIIARHVFEETGHGELLADFLVKGFGMKREELYLGQPTVKQVGKFQEFWKKVFSHGHFVEAAAALALYEEEVPKAMRSVNDGLRKHYGFAGESVIFFDIHTYIDIYHKRFGEYILSQYATTKELQEIAREAFVMVNNGNYEMMKAIYEHMPRR